MRLPNVVRWVLVVPSAIVAWYFALFVGALLFGSLVAPCWSSDAPAPAFCQAAWFPLELLEQTIVPFGAGLSAVLVVLVSAIVAPSHRAAVAWIALSVGAIVAGFMGYGSGAFTEAGVAVMGGLLAAVVVTLFTRTR
jgi:hypothetical protein